MTNQTESGHVFHSHTVLDISMTYIHMHDLPIHIDDLSRAAVAALRAVVLDQALLDGVQAVPGVAQSLYSGDLHTVTHVQREQALHT